jgi:hypothetical protein
MLPYMDYVLHIQAKVRRRHAMLAELLGEGR